MLSHSIAPRLRQRLMIEKSAKKAMYRYVLWRVIFRFRSQIVSKS